MATVLNTLSQLHHVRASSLADAATDTAVAAHFTSHGAPDVCVLVKYGGADLRGRSSAAATQCKRAGALVLFDCIDRHACFRSHELRTSAEFREVDGFLTQTEPHRQWLGTRGVAAALLPHPHGNSGGWGRSPAVGARLGRVGLMVGTTRNLPAQSELLALAAACCGAGARLVLVSSPNVLEGRRSYSAETLPCPAAGAAGERQGGGSEAGTAPAAASPRCSSPLRCRGDEPEEAAQLPRGALRPLHGDVGGQARFYNASELRGLVDVALLWPPPVEGLTGFAVHHRPPTRLHFWWSLGVPVVGYPMPAYVEAARRAGYPAELLHVASPAQVGSALCAIRGQAPRECLRRLALRGARRSSPQASAFELLGAACEIARQAPRSRRAGARRGGVITAELVVRNTTQS